MRLLRSFPLRVLITLHSLQHLPGWVMLGASFVLELWFSAACRQAFFSRSLYWVAVPCLIASICFFALCFSLSRTRVFNNQLLYVSLIAFFAFSITVFYLFLVNDNYQKFTDQMLPVLCNYFMSVLLYMWSYFFTCTLLTRIDFHDSPLFVIPLQLSVQLTVIDVLLSAFFDFAMFFRFHVSTMLLLLVFVTLSSHFHRFMNFFYHDVG